jgi:hypothetical protein
MSSSASTRPSGLLRGLLVWTALPFALFWLPLVRSVFDGQSYEWGAGWWGWRLGGAGVTGDLWYLILGTALGVTLLWSGWRGERAVLRWVLPVWFSLLLTNAVYWAWQDPGGFIFRGDTLGVELNLTWLAPGFHFVGLLLCLAWLRQDRQVPASARVAAPWTPRNTRRIVALLALLPVQFLLLRQGEVHGASDIAGVLVTIAQWFALGWALAPGPYRSGHSTMPTTPGQPMTPGSSLSQLG